MPTTRTVLCWLLLATMPCLSMRCDKCDECWEPPCDGKYLGALALHPASRRWLPLPAPDSIRFINSNGYRAVFDRVLPAPAAADSVQFSAYLNASTYSNDYSESSLNSSYPLCGPYFRAERVAWQYQARNLNLHLRLNLFRNLRDGTLPGNSATPLTLAAADSVGDIVVVAFNEQYYAEFPVVSAPYRQPRTTALGQATYLDSVQLAGRKFFGVYQFSRPAYTTELQPQRFFFQPGQGLVGFTYTNNEQWARW